MPSKPKVASLIAYYQALQSSDERPRPVSEYRRALLPASADGSPLPERPKQPRSYSLTVSTSANGAKSRTQDPTSNAEITSVIGVPEPTWSPRRARKVTPFPRGNLCHVRKSNINALEDLSFSDETQVPSPSEVGPKAMIRMSDFATVPSTSTSALAPELALYYPG